MSQQQASNKREGHTLLLGGLGGDSHSVGLTILRQSLSASGYQVRYLGTQNTLADFFQMASLSNLVMISSMDGHARYYLREFPALKRKFKTNGTRWYLGGNLSVSEGSERDFIEMGFNRVFMQFVDLTTVMEINSGGDNDAAPARQMANGANRLSYDLYSDAARTTVWGNTAGTGLGHTGTGAAVALTVYWYGIPTPTVAVNRPWLSARPVWAVYGGTVEVNVTRAPGTA